MSFKVFQFVDWNSMVYNGWIYVLVGLVKFDLCDVCYLVFMCIFVWICKELLIVLGLWIELWYDILFYVKQMMVEMGVGGELFKYFCVYVELNLVVWMCLSVLEVLICKVLKDQGVFL